MSVNRALLPTALLATLVTLGAASCSHVYAPSGAGDVGGAGGTGGASSGTTTATTTTTCPVGALVCVQVSDCPASTNACVSVLCEGGCCTSVDLPEGTPCPGGACIGAGACDNGGCVSNAECPAAPSPCVISSCDFQTGDCLATTVPDGTPTPGITQIQGDCRVDVCVGGMAVDHEDDTDVPAIPPAMAGCADAVCTMGVPSTPLHAKGSPCNTFMGNHPGVCSATGSCVQCVDDSECTPPKTCNGGVCM